MTQPMDAQILTHLANLEDPRDERGKDHHLIDIISDCHLRCDLWSRELGRYWTVWTIETGVVSYIPESKQWDFFTWHLCASVCPTHPKQMQQCFLSWITAISELSAGEVVAIDGKQDAPIWPTPPVDCLGNLWSWWQPPNPPATLYDVHTHESLPRISGKGWQTSRLLSIAPFTVCKPADKCTRCCPLPSQLGRSGK